MTCQKAAGAAAHQNISLGCLSLGEEAERLEGVQELAIWQLQRTCGFGRKVKVQATEESRSGGQGNGVKTELRRNKVRSKGKGHGRKVL